MTMWSSVHSCWWLGTMAHIDTPVWTESQVEQIGILPNITDCMALGISS